MPLVQSALAVSSNESAGLTSPLGPGVLVRAVVGTVGKAPGMGKKRKLRKQMRKRELEDATALVICVGKRCCGREESCALVEATRAYAEEIHASVPVVTVGCLDICEKGPIAAMYPDMKFKKHVTPKRARKMLRKLEERRASRTPREPAPDGVVSVPARP
jgi:(2Fe-2S) ferredoxin